MKKNTKHVNYFRPVLFLLLCLFLNPVAHAQTQSMTVDFNNLGNSLKKPGLGDLFPVYNFGTSSRYKELADGIFLTVASSQGMKDSYSSNIFSTDAISSIVADTDAKMICRFNDMIPGFPYDWSTLAYWKAQVTAATKRISENYKDQVLCIAPFNEPDNKMKGNFMTDPDIQGTTYDERVNWLWTQTINIIRGIDPDIPIMGPNYEFYYPWERNGEDQDRMRAFLQNAMDTNTVPDLIGWHKLGQSPGDVPFALESYYRPLEKELNLPGRPKPIVVEEFGPGTGDFEGVPGHMLKEMSELERSHVDYASMGIYTTSGQLGNTVRYPYNKEPEPNAGWYTLHWYKEMKGKYAPVSRWDTRYYQSFDGIASYDENSKTGTLILGGSDDMANITMKGIGKLISSKVRVQLQCAYWDTFPDEKNAEVENGGDAGKPYTLFDKTFTCNGNGDLFIPVHRLQSHHGYRILVSPVVSAEEDTTKFEAEDATVANANTVSNTLNASGGAYVSGINSAQSKITFQVKVPTKGLYTMLVRYASKSEDVVFNTDNTQKISVNGENEGVVNYPSGTIGTADKELLLTKKRLALEKGMNSIQFSKDKGKVALDFISIRSDTHRYDAEYCNYNNVRLSFFNRLFTGYNYIGGIDHDDSYIDFPLDVPKAGKYTIQIAYANGLGDAAKPKLSMNGELLTDNLSFEPTGSWLDASPSPNSSRAIKNVNVNLKQGTNTFRFAKGEGFAEVDYVKLIYGDETNLGVKNQEQTKRMVSIYPNPTQGKLQIFYSQNKPLKNGKIEIFDLFGKLILQQSLQGKNSNQLDISSFFNGIYLIKLVENGKVLGIQKVIKN